MTKKNKTSSKKKSIKKKEWEAPSFKVLEVKNHGSDNGGEGVQIYAQYTIATGTIVHGVGTADFTISYICE